MSRVGKNPINIPQGVTVNLEGSKVTVKGSKGELSTDYFFILPNQLPRGFLYRLQHFFLPQSTAYNIQRPCSPLYEVYMLVWSMHAMCAEVQHTRLSWAEWSQRLFVLSDPLL